MPEDKFDFAIAEIKYYQESRRIQELYDVSLSSSVLRIEEIITGDQLRSWRLVERLIQMESKTNESDYPVQPDHIRQKLMEE